MARKARSKPPPTDAERHARFVDMARDVEASDEPADFDTVFAKVAALKASRPKDDPGVS